MVHHRSLYGVSPIAFLDRLFFICSLTGLRMLLKCQWLSLVEGLPLSWNRCHEDTVSTNSAAVTRSRRQAPPMFFFKFLVFCHLPFLFDAAPLSFAHTLHELGGHLSGHVPPLLVHSCFELMKVLHPLASTRRCT